MAGIELKNLVKMYGSSDRPDVLAVDDVSFSITERQVCALVGPSGCGKTTVLNMLAGLLEPTSGTILAHRRNETVTVASGGSASKRASFRVGYVFQEPRLLNWRTVRQNLWFALRGAGVARSEWDKRTKHYLELVGLTEFVDHYPLFLSGGMQQRVGLARALAIEPEVLVMDEPFSKLDELTADRVRREVSSLFDRLQQTVMFVTHNVNEAAIMADVVVVFTDRPARVKGVVKNDVPRELRGKEEETVRVVSHVHEVLGRPEKTSEGGRVSPVV